MNEIRELVAALPDVVWFSILGLACVVYLWLDGWGTWAWSNLPSKISLPWSKPAPYVPEQPPEEPDWNLQCFHAWEILIADVSDDEDPVDPAYRKKVLDASNGFLNRRSNLGDE